MAVCCAISYQAMMERDAENAENSGERQVQAPKGETGVKKIPSPVVPLVENCSSSFFEDLVLANEKKMMAIEELTRSADELLSSLVQSVRKMLAAVTVPPPIISASEVGGMPRLPGSRYAFKQVAFPATPLYIKRRFDLSFRVLQRDATVPPVQFPLYCYITVRQITHESEEITQTRKGVPPLKGQTASVFTQGPVLCFSSLSFTDISSHYPQGRVNIVVKCANNEEIRPLTIEGVRVKARKKRRDEDF